MYNIFFLNSEWCQKLRLKTPKSNEKSYEKNIKQQLKPFTTK
jgi:hypothetical protein